MNICLIPARAGSKRIKNKNIRDFAGKPIIAHAIQTALTSQIFDHVIVSTDSKQIADIAKAYGAETPFLRPPELSDDHTATMPVIHHAIETLQKLGSSLNFVCCLYPTTPLLNADDIQTAWQTLKSSPEGLVFTATRYDFPVQRALRFSEQGGVEPFFPQYINYRSQDLEELVHDAGQFYFAHHTRFLNGPGVFSPQSSPLILPRLRTIDIDTEEDWALAQALYQAQSLLR